MCLQIQKISGPETIQLFSSFYLSGSVVSNTVSYIDFTRTYEANLIKKPHALKLRLKLKAKI